MFTGLYKLEGSQDIGKWNSKQENMCAAEENRGLRSQLKNQFFRYITPCRLVNSSRRFEIWQCHHNLQGQLMQDTLMIKALRSFETSLNIYRSKIPLCLSPDKPHFAQFSYSSTYTPGIFTFRGLQFGKLSIKISAQQYESTIRRHAIKIFLKSVCYIRILRNFRIKSCN